MIPFRSPTFTIAPHSTIPPHPVGFSNILSAAITNGYVRLASSVPPPPKTIPLRIQPTARSPSAVRVLSGLTRMLQ